MPVGGLIELQRPSKRRTSGFYGALSPSTPLMVRHERGFGRMGPKAGVYSLIRGETKRGGLVENELGCNQQPVFLHRHSRAQSICQAGTTRVHLRSGLGWFECRGPRPTSILTVAISPVPAVVWSRGRAVKGVLSSQLCIMNCAAK
jgi:hypothetical protein